MEFRVLGPLEVRAAREGEAVDVGGHRQRRLLARLLIDGGTVVSTADLVDAVWDEPDRPPAAERSLRTYVSRLRRSFARAEPGAGPIATVAPGYRADLASHRLDSHVFAALCERCRHASAAGDHVPAIDLADEALALWRGQPYPEVAGEPWALGEVRRLVDLHASLVEDRVDGLLALGRHREVVSELERATAEQPERSRRCAQLMVALHRSGRQADALRAFQGHRRALAELTGLEPDAELRRLEQRIAAGDETLDGAGDELRLRAYRLQERIGEGSFAVVWKGLQPALGREVAIKQIRAELANLPEFIRRFEAEAHLVARLEHPHIVPLYDYWREPGSAYLVLRWLRGGTLEDRVSEGPLALEACVRLATQVGGALSHAHRAGVVHRDVKSANVLIDGEGNFFLADFGIALDAAASAGPEAALSAGSPAYASPEQLRRAPVGPTADVHGLGIVLYEALTGQLPFPEERTRAGLLQRQLHDAIPSLRARRPELPAALDAVVQRATAKRPEDRYASASELVEEFTRAAGAGPVAASGRARGASTAVSGELENPYKGLRAFTEADVADFAGRARLVNRLVDHLSRPDGGGRFLAVVGPSGSGKSSVVRAGLVPAVRAGRVAGSDRWFVTSMVPGGHPFEELESALGRVAADADGRWADVLAADERGIARAVNGVLGEEDAELLLLVDQFEELFTLCDDEGVRARFLRALCAAVVDPRSRLRVVITLRADFWDRPLRYPELAALLDGGAVAVGPMAADELERAIVDPAARAGCEFEPGLVSEIVADVSDQPGSLPMMQYALTELFNRQVSGLLTIEAYRDLGGVAGALARRAEELFAGSDPAEQEAARRLFQRLVSLGEGTEDTRRRVARSELSPDAATAAAIERFGRARLLAFDHDPLSREPTVEVAHEALIREWPRLRSWLDADRDGLRTHRQMTEAARSWERADRDASELYRGGRLDHAVEWATAHPDELNAGELAFLDAATARRDADTRRERRQLRRLRTLLIGVAVALVVALLAGGVAAVQQRRANRNADLAAERADDTAVALERANAATRLSDLNRLQAESKAVAASDRRLAMLLALEASRLEDSTATQSTVLNALMAEPRFQGVLPGFDGVRPLALRVEGNVARTLSEIGALQDWDLTTGAAVSARTLPQVPERLGAGSAVLGREHVAISNGTTLHLIDLGTEPPTLRSLDHGLQNVTERSVAFSPDERTVYVAGLDGHDPANLAGRAIGFDTATGERTQFSVLQTSSFNAAVVVGGLLVTGEGVGRGLRFWDLASGTAVGERIGFSQGILRLVASADGRQLAVATQSPITVTVWDVAGRRQLAGPFDGPIGSVNAGMAFDPTGSLLAVHAHQGRTDVWDLSTGERAMAPLDANGGGEGWVGFSGDGTRLVVAPTVPTVFAMDGTISVARRLPVVGSNATWSADGARLAVSNPLDHTVTLLDGATGRPLATTPSGPPDPLFPGGIGPAAAFSPDGSLLAVGYNGTSVSLFDGRTGAPLGPPLLEAAKLLPSPRLAIGFTTGFSWSADGRRLAIGGWAGVWVVDVPTRSIVLGRFVLTDQIISYEAQLDPSGSLLYVTGLGQGFIAIVEVDTGRRRPDIREDGMKGRPDYFALSPDGQTLAIPSGSGAVDIYAVPDGRLIKQLRTHNEAVVIARWDRAARRLLAIGQSGLTKLVDVASGEVLEPGFTGLGTAVRNGMMPFAPGDQVFISAMPLGSSVAPTSWAVLLVDLDPEVWKRRACELAGRNLTTTEWDRFLPNGGAYRKTCEQWPDGLA